MNNINPSSLFFDTLNKLSNETDSEKMNEEYKEKHRKKVVLEGEELVKQRLSQIKILIVNLVPKSFIKLKSKLPLARIKRIMKIDKAVRMISAETLILISKACELFIIELASKSFVNAIDSKRRTIQKGDVRKSICSTENFDFLIDVTEDKQKNSLRKYSKKLFKSDYDNDIIFKSVIFPSFEQGVNKTEKEDYKCNILKDYLDHYMHFNQK